jgi:hypothetical protein
VTQTLEQVRAHLRSHFATAGADSEPDSASVTFLGTEPIEVLRYRCRTDGLVHYVSLGCSRHPMSDPTEILADRLRGPRAEVVLRLRDPGPVTGIARSVAILAATPAVDGVVLAADALIDLGAAQGRPGCSIHAAGVAERRRRCAGSESPGGTT